MASFHKPTISPQCLGILRQLAGIRTPKPSLSSHGQIRGKKKSAKQPHTINVQLLEDIRGYGRKGKNSLFGSNSCSHVPMLIHVSFPGSIIPIAPGRMRNFYFPQRKAAYVTTAQMRTVNQKDILPERDFNFGIERPEGEGQSGEEQEDKAVDVKIKLLTVRELIADFARHACLLMCICVAQTYE